MSARAVPPAPASGRAAVDEYIAQWPPAERAVLRRVRAIVRKEAPRAVERISYRMPAFDLDGMLIYYAAFKHHLGIFPPVKGDAALARALAPHRGEKGNLRFSFDEPMPYPLIRRVVQARLKEHLARRTAKRRTASQARKERRT